jgi:hypothetical protein
VLCWARCAFGLGWVGWGSCVFEAHLCSGALDGALHWRCLVCAAPEQVAVAVPALALRRQQLAHALYQTMSSALPPTPAGAVVNALSRDLEVTVWRGKKQYTQSFSRGLAQGSLQEAPAAPGAQKRGTRVRFAYDETIFSKT